MKTHDSNVFPSVLSLYPAHTALAFSSVGMILQYCVLPLVELSS